jgi:hypothetical protein
MSRIATVRVLLAVLAIAILLCNPAGICAGTPGAKSPSHPCCPKPAAEKAACVCIDRQPAAPTVPALADQPQLDIAEVQVPVLQAVAIPAPERTVDPVVALTPDAILLSIHQLLL